MKIMKCKVFFMLIMLLAVELTMANSPNVINYQGRLTTPSGTAVPNGNYSVSFALYGTPSGGSAYWGETQTVATVDGLFSAQIGTVSWFPTWLFDDSLRWLGIKVGTDPEMSPRTKLTAVPFAMNSYMGGGWKDYNSKMIQVNTYDSVGIGTIAPIRPLHVVEPNGGLFVSRFESSNSGATVTEFSNTSSSSVWETSVAGSAGAFAGWVTAGDMYFYKQGNSIPSIICKPDGHVAISRPSLYGSLDVGDPFDTIGGYFAVSANTAATHVIHSEFEGVGNFDAVAVYGKSTPADFYGYGGKFEGGYAGVRGSVNQNGTGNYYGVQGFTSGNGTGYKNGVYGSADGSSGAKYGIYGDAYGSGGLKHGVFGYAIGDAPNYAYGVTGEATGQGAMGMFAKASGNGAYALIASAGGGSTGNTGVMGEAWGTGFNRGVYGKAYNGTTNWAGYFDGNVHVAGTFSKTAGAFAIDHPLDPENKYLQHSFVESPDMMNIYNGNVTTDVSGYANITLPNWFEALNKDFRYQLTVLGQFAQAIVSEKIANNQFVIRTDKPNVEVSWQVTGIRKDAYAEANRIEVEVNKPSHEIGKYQFPKLFGKSEELGIGYRWEQDKSATQISSHKVEQEKMK